MRTALLLPLTLLLFAACSENKTLVLEERTDTTISPQGGTAQSADRALTVTFPPGALNQTTTIVIETFRNNPEMTRYQLSPSMQFAKPVAMEIKVEPNQDFDFQLVNLDGDLPVVVAGSSYDEVAGKVSGSVDHFSNYGARRTPRPCRGATSCGDPCSCSNNGPFCVVPTSTSSQHCDADRRCVPSYVDPSCGGGPDAGVMDVGTGTIAPPMDGGIIEDAGTSSCASLGVWNVFESEPNNQRGGEDPIPADNPGVPEYIGWIHATLDFNDVDGYSFTLTRSSTVHVVTYNSAQECVLECPPPLDTRIGIQRLPNGPVVSDDNGGMNACSQLILPLGPGDYRMTVEHGSVTSSASLAYGVWVQTY